MKENIPIHIIIREAIINDILRDNYEPGMMIPPQAYFAKKYHVSRTTVRKAIDELVERQVLATTKGKGTIVRDYKRSRHGYERALSYSAAIQEHGAGRLLESKLISVQNMKADCGIAKQLQIQEKAPVWCIQRLRIVDGIPYCYQISYLNAAQVKEIDFHEEDLEKQSLFHLLQVKAGLVPKYQEEEIRAVYCPAEIAKHFKVRENSPVLLVFRTVYNLDDVPMEYCEEYECSKTRGFKITTYAKNNFWEDKGNGNGWQMESEADRQ